MKAFLASRVKISVWKKLTFAKLAFGKSDLLDLAKIHFLDLIKSEFLDLAKFATVDRYLILLPLQLAPAQPFGILRFFSLLMT